MNIIKEMTRRIEETREHNKVPCKNYATEEAAEKALAKMATLVGQHHGTRQADYVVFYNEAWGRWVGAISLNELLQRADSWGGYIGLSADRGFYSF
jgi:hypothetical protein|tara:strand:+ start:442 stop:729 length:288 start_codon:yes stop_codon:yes gene_type:complete